jgi:hypothetical protein
VPTVVDLRVLGVAIRVEVAGPELVEPVRNAWHLCLDPADPTAVDASAERSTVSITSHPTDSPIERARALQGLTQSVTAAAIRRQAGRAVMFHAGALANPQTGAAVAYVAPGGTGKTTLTRVLGPGLGYLTDETVAVVEDQRILPYPKPLSIRRNDGAKDEVAPGRLGLRLPSVEPRLAALLLIRRDPGVGAEPDVVHLTLLDALAALSPEVSSLARLPSPLRSLADVVEGAGGLLKATYAEAASMRPLVAELIGLPVGEAS